jgi:hypothetical protein
MMTSRPARSQRLPGAAQYCPVVRHGVVGQAEQHPVERLGRDKVGGVAFVKRDIAPVLACAARPCPLQHAGRKIDAIDAPIRSDRVGQIGKADSGAAADFQHALAAAQPQVLDGAPPQSRRQKHQTIEQRNEFGQAIIAALDHRAVAVHPAFVRGAPPPKHFDVPPPKRK